MALGPVWIASIVLAAITALIGIGLFYAYAKNLRQAKTRFTVGLVIFAAVVVAENVCTTYIYFNLAGTYTAVLAMPLMFLKALELSGFAILSYITLRL